MLDLLWQYILIFLMAATPWLEILIVIPVGVGMGLEPFLVGFVSFIGNFLPVLFIVYLLHYVENTQRFRNWKAGRLKKKRRKRSSSRGKKAESLFIKYGLPGLAVLGPALTGIHLAAVIALSLKAGKHETAWWMAISLAGWTIFLTIASIYSIDWIQNLFS
jgi:uncharacterized membrane protein